MLASVRAKLVGFRTMFGAAAIGVVGALSTFGDVDLQPLIALFVKDQAKLGALMVCIAIFFGSLRYFTTTPVGQSAPAVDQTAPAPAAKGVDEGT